MYNFEEEIRSFEEDINILNDFLVELDNKDFSSKEDFEAFLELLEERRNLIVEKYDKIISEYENIKDIYDEELYNLYEMQEQVINGNIPYAEYEQRALYMAERYRYISDLYNSVKSLKDEILEKMDGLTKVLDEKFRVLWEEMIKSSDGSELSPNDPTTRAWNELMAIQKRIEDLAKNLYNSADYTDEEVRQLEEEIARLEEEYDNELQDELYYRAHMENGMESHDDSLDNLRKKIDDKKKELEELKNKKAKDKGNVLEPDIPMIIEDVKDNTKDDDKEIIEDNPIERKMVLKNLTDLAEMLNKYEFTKMDNFAYKYKNVKIFNVKKRKERTFADKPFKYIIRGGFGALILGAGKSIAKIASTDALRKEKMQFAEEVINKFTDEELWYIYNNELTSTNLKEKYGVLSDFCFSLLYDRMSKLIQKEFEKVNGEVYVHYKNIIDMYQDYLTDLNNGLSKKELNEKYSSAFLNEINQYRQKFLNNDKLGNKIGYQAIMENFSSRFNNLIGGINSKNDSYSHMKELAFANKYDYMLRDALVNNEGIEAAEAFLREQQAFSIFEEQKRTLKNRFGYASTGAFDYNPIPELADYSKSEFASDVLHTVMLVSSIFNTINVINLKSELLNANAINSALNQQIQQQNNVISDIQKLLSSNPEFDPNNVADKLAVYLANANETVRQSGEYMQAIAEAGSKGVNFLESSGKVYNSIDDLIHQNASDFIDKIKQVYSTYSGMDRVKKLFELTKDLEMNQKYIYNFHSSNIGKYINTVTNSSHVENWNSLLSFPSAISQTDPTFLVDECNAVLDLINNVSNLQPLSAAQLIGNVSAVPALLTLSSVALDCGVPKDKLDPILDSATRHAEEKIQKSNLKEKLREDLETVKFDDFEDSEKKYNDALQAWNEKSAFYKLIHYKEKPKRIDYYITDEQVEEERRSRYGV